ncbi:12462_t:CDS:1, partial [Gigaspora margarita]
KQRHAEDQLCKLNELYNIARNPERWYNFLTQINETKQEIEDEKKETKINEPCYCTSQKSIKEM